MNGVVLGLFLVAAFVGGFASGLAGFAMGFVVSGIWLHILSPIETTTLIVGYGFFDPRLRRLEAPACAGLAQACALHLRQPDRSSVRNAAAHLSQPGLSAQPRGRLLLIYAIHGLAQPTHKPVAAGAAADAGIGFANGVLAGLTGLPGFVITIWCQLRGWTKDLQRAVFQPVILAAIMVNAVSLGIAGTITAHILQLYLLGLPVMAAGLWLGFTLYGKLDEAAFRRLILVLLLLAGLGLIALRI